MLYTNPPLTSFVDSSNVAIESLSKFEGMEFALNEIEVLHVKWVGTRTKLVQPANMFFAFSDDAMFISSGTYFNVKQFSNMYEVSFDFDKSRVSGTFPSE